MCGISGAIGSNIKMDKIKLLGIANISRGSKGAGCFVNDQVYKVINDYGNLLPSLPSKAKSKFVLNHNRKPSGSNYGHLSDTHPFVRLDTVFCHNGTISNLADLEKLTNIPKTVGSIDSQYLHELLLQDNYDWLSIYTGSATFVYKNEDSIFIFVGGKTNKFGELEPDRELHYCYIGKTMYFSSEKKHLEIVSEENEIFEFPVNELLEYDLKGNLVNSTKIDRDNIEGKIIDILYNDLDLNPDIFGNLEQPYKNRLFYYRGCYYFEGKPYTGSAYSYQTAGNPTAIYPDKNKIKSTHYSSYLFYNGMLVSSLIDRHNWDRNLTVAGDFFGLGDPYDDSIISQYFDNEFLAFDHAEETAFIDEQPAHGVIQVPGTETKYEFNNGKFVRMFLKDELDFEEDLGYLVNDISKLLENHKKTELKENNQLLLKIINNLYEELCSDLELQD
jgi:hypothetical protein